MDEPCQCTRALDASFQARAYADRADAGQRLADLTEGKWWQDVLVLAIGRGGVLVGAEIARRLGAELDVMAVRKVRAPQRPELNLGAACPDGSRFFNEALIHSAGVSKPEVERAAERAVRKAREREARWRPEPPCDVTGRSVLLVDDGIETGATLRACIAALRRKELRVLAAAAPVGVRDSCEQIAPLVDTLICPLEIDTLVALGHHYRSFPQVSDRQIQRVLLTHRAWLAELPSYARARNHPAAASL